MRIHGKGFGEVQSADIIQAFYGPTHVERAFKNVKNPHHLAVRPQFHWTNQKIAVHYVMGVLGYWMTAIRLRKAKANARFTGGLDSLLEPLGRHTPCRLHKTHARAHQPNGAHGTGRLHHVRR